MASRAANTLHPMGAGADLDRVLRRAIDTGLDGEDGRRWASPRLALLIIAARTKGGGWFPMTAAQLADLMGCCRDTASTALYRLEGRGWVTWDRGGLVDGKWVPGRVRINRAALLAAGGGLAKQTARRAKRATEGAARLEKLLARGIGTLDNGAAAARGRARRADQAKRAGHPMRNESAPAPFTGVETPPAVPGEAGDRVIVDPAEVVWRADAIRSALGWTRRPVTSLIRVGP